MEYGLSMLLTIIFLIVLIFETYLIITRNKKIKIKGKDDFFIAVIILLFILVLFPLDFSTALINTFRNTTAILAVFASFAVKRGLMDKGVAKFGFVIPWNKVEIIYLEPYQSMKIAAIFKMGKIKLKLIFHIITIKEVFENLTSHGVEVMVEKSLNTKLK